MTGEKEMTRGQTRWLSLAARKFECGFFTFAESSDKSFLPSFKMKCRGSRVGRNII